LVKESIVCYSSTDGKMMKLSEGTEIEVLKSYNDAIHFEYDSEQYTLKNDNLVYFNWWFEPIEDQY